MLIHHLARRLVPGGLKPWAAAVNARIPHAVKVGRSFWRTRRLLAASRSWTREETERWQTARLRTILEHAYRYVDGYHELFDQAHVRPDDLRTLADLQRFPFTTKELFRDNLAAFTSRRAAKLGAMYVTTGGSTAIPFGFRQTDALFDVEAAFVVDIWGTVGFRWGDRVGIIRGSYVGSPERLWRRYNEKLYRGLEISSYYLTAETYPRVRDAIVAFRPPYLHVYPSAGAIFAELAHDAGDAGRFDFVRGVLTASENLYAWQRESLARTFPAARVFDFYGHAEKATIASWCERSDLYHVWPQYGVAEVVATDGSIVDENGTGELVSTSLWNVDTPFIRYRTRDSVECGPRRCDACGRPWPTWTRIAGRAQELIVTADGRYISMTALNMHNDLFDAVKQFQFYQDSPGRVLLRLLPKSSYRPADGERIAREIGGKLGEGATLEIAIVDAIAPTASGKHRFLDQRLSLRYDREGGA